MKYLYFLFMFFPITTVAEQLAIPVTQPSQLVGCWKRLRFAEETEKKFNKIEVWPLRYAWFCFEENGELYTTMSTRDRSLTLKQLKDMATIFGKDQSFSIVDQGIVVMKHHITGQKLLWGARILKKAIEFDNVRLEPGILIMGIPDPQTLKEVFLMHLQPVTN